MDGRNKTYLCFTFSPPENISKVQKQTGATLPQKAFTKVAVALRDLKLGKVATVDLCPCTGSWGLSKEFTAMSSEDPLARSGRATELSEHVPLQGQVPLC